MKFNYKFILIIIFLKFLIVNSQINNYSQLNEKSCIDNLLKSINNQFDNNIDYCSNNHGIKCLNNYVTEIEFNRQNSSTIITPNYFSCFSQLVSLKLSNFNLGKGFLNGPFSRNLTILYLNKNNLNGNIPMMIPGFGLKDINLSDNNLSGSIQSPWCFSKLNIKNNKNINGYLPCCFSFFYNDQLVNSWFQNTSVVADDSCLNQNFPKMNIDINDKKTFIVGGYLGYHDNSFVTTPSFNWVMEKPGILFSCENFSKQQIFNISFPSNGKSFTIANYQSPPILNSYSIDQSTFFGSFFGNNKDLLNLEIQGIANCTISNSSFYTITTDSNCSSLFNENKSYNIIISNGYQSSSFMVNPIDGNVCSNDKCNQHGLCDLSKQGQCNCDTGYLNYNNTCIEPVQCENNCWGQGECDHTIGKCQCSSIWQGDQCNIPYINCPSINSKMCSGSGTCNNQTGVCSCDSLHQSFDCSLPFIQCPNVHSNICSGSGTCNNQTGVCTCNSSHQSLDCSVPFVPCDDECLVNGKCDNTTGICHCYNPVKWFGSLCQYPYQYVTTIEPATNLTNNIVNFIGWFGNTYYNNLSIEITPIGPCKVLGINETVLSCKILNETIPEGIYGNATVTQNNNTWIGINQYYFERVIKECPNNCTNLNQGRCIDGICQCSDQWIGFDCNTFVSNQNQLIQQQSFINNIISNNGTSIITSKQNDDTSTINYQFFITNLLELDIYGNVIRDYKLYNNWQLNSIEYTSPNYNVQYLTKPGKILKFSQVLQLNQPWFQSSINLTVEDVSLSRIESFVNTIFPLESNSIKISLSINNYQFSNSLNTLQLVMNSTMKTLNNKNHETCYKNSGNNITTIETDQFNYFLILKENIKLYGKFLNKIIADGRITWISQTIQIINNGILSVFDTLIIKLNLPHCTSECIIDPDLTMLIDSLLKISPECINGQLVENNLYLVAIIVVVSVIILSILITIGILFYRKKYIENQLKKKLKRLRDNNFKADSRKDKNTKFNGILF